MPPHKGLHGDDNNNNNKKKKSTSFLSSVVDEVEYKGSFFTHLIAGSCAGIMEHSLMFPIDVIKTKIYAGNHGRRVRNVMKRSFFDRSLYRGINIAILGAIPSHAILFSSYELSKKVFGNSTFGIALSGVVSTFSHDLVANIFGTIKTRLILREGSGGGYKIFRHVVKKEGFKGFFISFPFSFLMNIPFSVGYYVVYEKTKQFLDCNYNLTPNQIFIISGGLAGGFGGFISNPFDIMKINLMKKNTGMKDVFKQIHINRKGFFRGSIARSIYYIPSGVITWFTYENVKKLLS